MRRTWAGWVVGMWLLVACATEAPDSSRRRSSGLGTGGGPAPAPLAGSGGSFGNPPPSTGFAGMAPPPMPVDDGNCNQDVDVVFTLDVSGSMVPPLTRLVEEVGMVDAALLAKNLPSPPHYGLVIFVDDVVMMNGGQPF